MNKIVVAVPDQKEQLLIEEILYDIVNANCAELLFVVTLEQAREIMHRQVVQLIFIDETLVRQEDELWQSYKGHRVVLCSNKEHVRQGEGYLLRPLKKELMLEKCYQSLDLQAKSGILFSL